MSRTSNSKHRSGRSRGCGTLQRRTSRFTGHSSALGYVFSAPRQPPRFSNGCTRCGQVVISSRRNSIRGCAASPISRGSSSTVEHHCRRIIRLPHTRETSTNGFLNLSNRAASGVTNWWSRYLPRFMARAFIGRRTPMITWASEYLDPPFSHGSSPGGLSAQQWKRHRKKIRPMGRFLISVKESIGSTWKMIPQPGGRLRSVELQEGRCRAIV